MRWSDYLRYAAGALRRIWLRSLLTVLGVTIGTAAVVLLVGFGVQSERHLTEALSGEEDLAKITVYSERLQDPRVRRHALRDQGKGAGSGAQAADADAAPRLDDAALEGIRALAGVKDVYPNVFFAANLVYEAGDEPVASNCVAVGLSPGVSREDLAAQLSAGSPLSGGREVIITYWLARDLAGDGDWRAVVGQTVSLRYLAKPPRQEKGDGEGEEESDGDPKADPAARLRTPTFGDESFVIVGVLDRQPSLSTTQSTFGEVRPDSVILPMAEAARLYHLADNPQNFFRLEEDDAPQEYLLASVVVDSTRPEDVKAVRDQLHARGLLTVHIYDLIEWVSWFFLFVNVFLAALGSVALVVATLQITNTMTMAVLERRREIGVMKAIGARDRDIRRLFLAEAGLIGLTGALLGTAIAWGASRAVELGVEAWLSSEGASALGGKALFALPTWLFGGAVAFGVVVSLVAAFIPAWRAARVAPAIALRND